MRYQPEVSEEDYQYQLQCDEDYERWLDEMDSEEREEYIKRNFYDY